MTKKPPSFLQTIVRKAIRNLLRQACQPQGANLPTQSIEKDESSPPIPASIRPLVLQRDQQRCVLCGRSSREIPLEVNYIIPFSKGGSHELDNLQTLCKDCNHGEKARSF